MVSGNENNRNKSPWDDGEMKKKPSKPSPVQHPDFENLFHIHYQH